MRLAIQQSFVLSVILAHSDKKKGVLLCDRDALSDTPMLITHDKKEEHCNLKKPLKIMLKKKYTVCFFNGKLGNSSPDDDSVQCKKKC